MLSSKSLDSMTQLLVLGTVLDNNNAHEVMQGVDAALKENKRHLICDMSAVEFLSSTGVGSIISSLSLLRRNGGELVLFGLSEKIMHVLASLDLQDHIPIETDLEHATARLHSSAKTNISKPQ